MSLLEANNKRMILRMEEEQRRKIAQAVEARKQFPYQLIRTQEIEEDSLLLLGRKWKLWHFSCPRRTLSLSRVHFLLLRHLSPVVRGSSFSIAQSCPNTDYDGSGGNIWLLSLKGLLQGSTKESFRMRHYSSKKCLTKNLENGKHFGSHSVQQSLKTQFSI